MDREWDAQAQVAGHTRNNGIVVVRSAGVYRSRSTRGDYPVRPVQHVRKELGADFQLGWDLCGQRAAHEERYCSRGVAARAGTLSTSGTRMCKQVNKKPSKHTHAHHRATIVRVPEGTIDGRDGARGGWL